MQVQGHPEVIDSKMERLRNRVQNTRSMLSPRKNSIRGFRRHLEFGLFRMLVASLMSPCQRRFRRDGVVGERLCPKAISSTHKSSLACTDVRIVSLSFTRPSANGGDLGVHELAQFGNCLLDMPNP